MATSSDLHYMKHLLAAMATVLSATCLAFGQAQPPITDFPIATTRVNYGILPVTNVNVGMQAGGVFDNASLVPTLMTAISSSIAHGTGGEVVFPRNAGDAGPTIYYFTQPLGLSRSGRFHCATTGTSVRQNNVTLLFAAGVDGVEFFDTNSSPDGGFSTGMIEGCRVQSLGHGTGALTHGSGTITGAATDSYESIAGTGWSAGDGIIGIACCAQQWINTPRGAYLDAVSGSIGNQTLTLHSGQTISLAHKFTTAVVSNGSTTVTCNNRDNSVGPVCSTGSIFVNMPVTGSCIPASTTISGFTATTITLSQAATCNASDITWYNAGALSFNTDLYRLPAALVSNVNTTIGSSTITVVSGPTQFRSGDWIWSDAFPFGTTVATVSGAVGSQTLTVYGITAAPDNIPLATVTHTGGNGKLWKIPAGNHRYLQSQAQKNYYTGWPIGMLQACTSAGGVNCTTSYDNNNSYERNIIGRLTSGNNSGASNSVAEETVRNNLYPVAELGTIGTNYYGMNTNDGSRDTLAPWIFNCANQNITSIFGGYDDFGWGPFDGCMGGVGVEGAVAGPGSAIRFVQNGDSGIGPNGQSSIVGGPPTMGMPWTFQKIELGGTSPCFKFFDSAMMFSKDCATANQFKLAYDATNDVWTYNGALLSFYGNGFVNAYAHGQVGSHLGFFIGPGVTNSFADDRKVDLAQSAPSATGRLRGDRRWHATPSAGGFAGWIETADGATFTPYGPVAFDTNGFVWGTPPITVSQLPTCNAGMEGGRAYVTDQNTAVAYRGAVTGSGSTRQAVLCSNSAWIQD